MSSTVAAATPNLGLCNLSMVTWTSKKPCVPGVGFGCEREDGMWIGLGCRGTFVCGGHQVTCGFSGNILSGDPARHFCPCAPMQQGGLFQTLTAQPVRALPASLRDPPPRLNDVKRLGTPRFVPRTMEEVLTATYTTWNLLDAMMVTGEPNYAWQTGYVRELQLKRMVQLARTPGIRTYCEIGFNGGHSAAAMLYANPDLIVHSFDLMMWQYSNATTALVRSLFGQRFRMHRGDSRQTVPAWARLHPHKCDLTFVDGDHTIQGAMIDMINMRNATADGALAVADDINSDPGTALETLRALGLLTIAESYGPFDAPHIYNPCMRGPVHRAPICNGWGFAVFQYVSQPKISGDVKALMTSPTEDGHLPHRALMKAATNQVEGLDLWLNGRRKPRGKRGGHGNK